jgi:hypothetical protein
MQTRPSLRKLEMLEDEPQQSLVSELLFPLPAHRRTTLGILVWWESRRLLYNVLVGAAGSVTLAVMAIVMVVAPPQGGIGPIFPEGLLPILAYGVLANVCYTLGPIIETTLERVWKDQVLPVGPALFRQGLAFSIGLTLLPIPMVIGLEVLRVIRFLVK